MNLKTLRPLATRLNTSMLVVATLILITIVGMSYREWTQFGRSREDAARAREIQNSLNRLTAHILDAETGQRGFLLTGADRYLEPYNRATRDIPADLASLGILLSMQPDEAHVVPQLNGLVEQKLTELRQTIDVRKARGAAPALDLVLSDRGKRIMDEIRDLLSEIQRREYSAQSNAQYEAAEAAQRAFLITGVGSLILLFFSVIGTLTINSAIRSREEAFHEAQRARDSLRTTIASIGDAVVVTDVQGRIVSANKVAQSLLRVPEEELVGKPLGDVFQIVNEFTRAQVESPVTKVLREGKIAGLANHTVLIARDGTEIPIDDSGAPIHGESSGIQGTVLVFRDITERRGAERNAAYLEAIVASSDAAIIGKSLDGIIQSWNTAAERLYGYRAEEIIGHPAVDLIPPDRVHEESDILEQMRRGGRIIHFETVRRRKDGTPVNVSLVISPIRDKSGQIIGISHVARDITEQKAFAENLRQTQKLESLGILAGGIAHDFNNLLVGILGNASMALSEIPGDSPARGSIEGVLAASERAAQLTRQMLAYSGKGRFVLEPIDLSARIRETVPLIQAAIPRTVVLQLHLVEGLPAIEADPSQIQQLVMNIVINGAEAIPEGHPGAVTITTRIQDVHERYIGSHTEPGALELEPGKYILLEIRDSGSGMNEATRARMFDPFFTTKFTGRGLGLAAVQGIVRGHGGSIDVSSAPGQGTIVRVLLPAQEQRVQPALQKQQRSGDLRGSGAVLVVDDEEMVRKFAQQVLEQHGYTLLLAEDGERGVEIFRRESHRIRCVVLDLTMPLMSGAETLARMKELRADIPIILSSGFSEADAVRRFEGKGLAGFLQKPYQITALLEGVKSAIGYTAPAG
jgi:PAS domain S-box-containing protein